ncbi:MAG: hypothetical protein AUJ49_08495 [Desulfovibrionaceae bacterium CG1_02_65_16]|nr:MAG: hypothetical protein AUJ49_08495 [Desulfovibrionaceae bacterium CG1_02_65_16]
MHNAPATLRPRAAKKAIIPEVMPPRRIMPGQARVIGCPNPFTSKLVDGWAPAGMTVREAVAELARLNNIPAGWARHGHIWVDGRKVPRARWDEVQLRAGQLVNFRIVPAGGGGGGGGGKNPMRMVMSIAVMAAAWYYAPYIAANFTGTFAAAGGGSIFGGSLITTMSAVSAVIGGGMTLAGNALINAIAPVSSSVSSSTSSTSTGTDEAKTAYSLSGSSNSARKYEPLPVVLGKVRRSADHAALPYSEASGSDQWGHYLFFWGLGPLTVTEMKLGETDLSVFLKSAARDILPEMEATTTSGATITASVNSSTAWYLGNNSHTNYWSGGAELPVDVYFDLGSKRGVQGYTLRPYASYLASMATACELAYSLDAGETYTTVDTQSGLTWPDATKQKFDFSSVVQARYWRLRITAVGASGTLYMDEVELLGGLLIETHEGREGEADFTLYSGNTHEETIGATLPWEDDETQEYTIRYTEAGCTGFEIELYASQGLWRYPLNTSYAYGVEVTVEALYRLKGSTDELKRVGAQDDAGWTIKVGDVESRVDRRACRFTLGSGTLESGQYEIHQRRIARKVGNSNTEDGTIFDTLVWSVLRTFRPGQPVTLPLKWAGSALCAKANEDFTGSLPVFSGVCASECLDWDAETETWITRQTSNPASLMRYWLQHPCRLNSVPDERINLAQLQRFHAFCKTKGFEFNGETCIRSKSIRAVLRQICAAGRGSHTLADGIYSVVWDDVQDEICQIYNDRNCWSFKEDAAYGKIPHALRVSFEDEENDYQTDEAIVYDDGYDASNATLFESTSFDGVTNHAQIQRMGRNYLAQLRLRPRKYSWNTTMQYLIAPRGKLAGVATSVIKVGLVAARIKSVTWSEAEEGEEPEFVLAVKLDQACAMEEGTAYALQYRRSDGKVTTQPVEYVAFETQELTFAEPVLAIMAPEEDGLCTFGTAAAPSLTLLIETIVPSEDFTATITAVDYSPGIFTADTLPIPAWESHITQPVYGRKVATPVILSIRSAEETILVETDGTLTVRAEIAFSIPSGAPVAASAVEAQYRIQGTEQWSESVVSPVGVGALYITGVEEGLTYEFRLRATGPAGLAGNWSAIAVDTIIGKTTPPPAIDALYQHADGLYWTYGAQPVDFAGYRVRICGGMTRVWEKGTDWPSADTLLTSRTIPVAALGSGVQTIMVKAVDTTGNESETAVYATINLGEYSPANVIITQDERARGWSGIITGGHVDESGDLVANDTGESYLPDATSLYIPQPQSLYLPINYSSMSYAWPYIPAVDDVPGTAYLTADIEGDGWSVQYRRRGSTDKYLGQDDDAYLPDAAALYLGGATPWAAIPGTGIVVGHERLDFVLTTEAGSHAGAVKALSISIDVADVVESFAGLVILSTGTRVPITKTYRAIDSVGSITLRDDEYGATGIQVKDKDATLGPLLAALGAGQATIDITNLKGH